MNCKNCGAIISKDSDICPYCDSQTPKEGISRNNNIFFTISTQTVEKRVENEQEMLNHLHIMFNDTEEFVVLSASEIINGISFIQACQSKENLSDDKEKNIFFEVGLEGGYIFGDKMCNSTECVELFRCFYSHNFKPDIKDYTPINDEKKFPAKELFEINIGTLEKKPMATWSELCAWLNNNETIEDFISFFEQVSQKATLKDSATQNHNKEIFSKAYMKISDQLVSDEKPLYWKDDAILRLGEKGIMLTDKNIFFVKKKQIYRLPLKDVKVLTAPQYGNAWYINENKVYEINTLACTPEEHGVILAFICTMARDLNSPGYKIIANEES